MWARTGQAGKGARRVCLAAVALALVSLSVVADQRRPVDPGEEAWRAVGRINQGNGAFCTGVLIAPDLVVTAAHCLYHPRTGRRLQASAVHFVAGWADGRAAAHRFGAKIAQSPLFDPGAPPSLTAMSTDIALVRLSSPVPAEIAPLPLAPPQRGERPALVVSYARDRPHLASMEPCLADFPDSARRPVLAGCASVEGASGAPLLVETPAGYAVAAVISGRMGEGDGAMAVAAPLHPSLKLLSDLLE